MAIRAGLWDQPRLSYPATLPPEPGVRRTCTDDEDLSVPNIRWLLAMITRLHRFLYRASGGRVGARLGRSLRVLLLEHLGRRTGLERVTPLLYVPDGGSFVVVASNAGDDRHPAWWLNLKKQPQAWVQVGTARHAVIARQASLEESARLWGKLDASYKAYAEYRQRTTREIPIVILDPAS